MAIDNGVEAPDFTLKTQDDEEWTLSSSDCDGCSAAVTEEGEAFEARLVFERIVCDHDVELAGAPRRRSTFTLRGYESVPIRLTPR